MRYPFDTTIAVTDGRSFRLFRNLGNEMEPRLEELPAPQIAAQSHGATRQHHQGEANPTERDLTENSHSAAVVDWLNDQVTAGHIRQLMIVAPPRTLGALRPRYTSALRAKLLGELNREHTRDTVQRLQEALSAAESLER